jgi:hypothetical protein
MPVADSETIDVDYDSAARADAATSARWRKQSWWPSAASGFTRRTTLCAPPRSTASASALPRRAAVAASFEAARTCTGWAPHASQPKALKPGSAAQRLAEALGTTEIERRRESAAGVDRPGWSRSARSCRRASASSSRDSRLFFHLVTLPWILSLASHAVACGAERADLVSGVEKALDVVPTAMFVVAGMRVVCSGPSGRSPARGWLVGARDGVSDPSAERSAGMTFLLLAALFLVGRPLDPSMIGRRPADPEAAPRGDGDPARPARLLVSAFLLALRVASACASGRRPRRGRRAVVGLGRGNGWPIIGTCS